MYVRLSPPKVNHSTHPKYTSSCIIQTANKQEFIQLLYNNFLPHTPHHLIHYSSLQCLVFDLVVESVVTQLKKGFFIICSLVRALTLIVGAFFQLGNDSENIRVNHHTLPHTALRPLLDNKKSSDGVGSIQLSVKCLTWGSQGMGYVQQFGVVNICVLVMSALYPTKNFTQLKNSSIQLSTQLNFLMRPHQSMGKLEDHVLYFTLVWL